MIRLFQLTVVDRTFRTGAQMRRYVTGQICPDCGKPGVRVGFPLGDNFFCHTFVRQPPQTEPPSRYFSGIFAQGGCTIATLKTGSDGGG